MNKATLIRTFEEANLMNSDYVFVLIEAEGIKECIAIPNISFESKKDFYLNAYDDSLVHVMNSNVRITNCGHGDESKLSYFV